MSGQQGEQGEQGEPGRAGLIGKDGVIGERGQQGDHGQHGERGREGETGKRGAPGINSPVLSLGRFALLLTVVILGFTLVIFMTTTNRDLVQTNCERLNELVEAHNELAGNDAQKIPIRTC